MAGMIRMCLSPEIALMQSGLGMLTVSIPLLILACMIPGSIGGGDIKLMAAGGFLLGITGVWNAFVTGVMSAGLYIVISIILKRVERKSEIALGPFLSIGMILVLLKS